jgi:hypothetical protein
LRGDGKAEIVKILLSKFYFGKRSVEEDERMRCRLEGGGVNRRFKNNYEIGLKKCGIKLTLFSLSTKPKYARRN